MRGYDIAKTLLFRLDAEVAHERAIDLLRLVSLSPQVCAAVSQLYAYTNPRLEVNLLGQTYSSPVGVAAGFDKNGAVIPALQALGFSFVEVGTVTPRPQPGNHRPRIFRLHDDRALVNRMGFPSLGMNAVAKNLGHMADRLGMLGLNIGPNKESVEAGTADQDCVAVLERLHNFPNYIVVNVSSPNTARLRELQGREALHRLLSRVVEARNAYHHSMPLLVKISPDLTDEDLDAILQVAIDLNLAGIVATNTTISRPATLLSTDKSQTGGLSGVPLRDRSAYVVRRIYRETDGQLPIIAAGGVFEGVDVLRLIGAGATLVQIYTGLVYRGPSVARDIKRSLVELLDHYAFDSIAQARGQIVLP